MYDFDDAIWFTSGEKNNGKKKCIFKKLMHTLFMCNIIFGCHVLEVFHVYF